MAENKEYSFEDFKKEFESLSEEYQNRLKNVIQKNGIIITSIEQARAIMNFTMAFDKMAQLFKKD